MAPEILLKLDYQGQVVDLFALGVILFFLYSGRLPFEMAIEEDVHYGYIVNHRTDEFWSAHTHPNPQLAVFYSDDFKDLVIGMLQ